MLKMNLEIKSIIKSKIVQNAGWLMSGKIVHMVLAFILGLFTARYLGPGNYGLINYASAYSTFFMAFCTLGINSIIVKKFVDEPENEGVCLGTTIGLRMISTILSVAIILLVVLVIDRGEPLTIIVVMLYSTGLIFHCFDSFKQWFQAKLMSKFYAIATMVSYLFVTIYKIFLLIAGKSVIWFAVSNSLDYLVIAIFLYVFYKRVDGPRMHFSIKKGRELLSESYNYILSGLMIAIYGSTDRFMLKQLLNESEVGYYSLALSLSCIWTFVLSAFIESIIPSIMQYHNTNKALYEKANKRLYAGVFYISVITSMILSILAPFIVYILYGSEYLSAVKPLRIVVWYVAFSYLGVARDTWIVCEKKQKNLKYIYLGAAVCNVVLNSFFIPKMGASGAAITTLFTQISTVFIFPLCIKEYHPNVKLMVEAICLKGLK